MTVEKSFQNRLKTIDLTPGNYPDNFSCTFVGFTHLSTFLKDN